MRAFCMRLLHRAQYLLRITIQVAHSDINLSQGDAQWHNIHDKIPSCSLDGIWLTHYKFRE
jgi:hypothetical protein